MKDITKAASAQQKWMELIRQQEESGTTVKVFCGERNISEPSFYSWRKRLGASGKVRFALVDTGATVGRDGAPMELILSSGDRLRIATGTDAATLRTVLSVLRERA